MTQDPKALDDATIDALLAETRLPDPTPDPALIARVLMDATEVQRGLTAPRQPARARWGDRFLGAVGGWGGAGALAGCACLGLVLGLSDPGSVTAYLPGVTDSGATLEFYEAADDVAALVEG